MDSINVRGKVHIDKVTVDGRVESYNIPNTIVTVGKAMLANLIVADIATTTTGSKYDWMAIGLGSSTIVAGNTVLGSEYMKVGIGSVTGSTTTTTTTNDTARFIGSFTMDATKSVNEAGLFNQSGLNLGSMLARTTFTNINVVSGDRINATWDIIFA